MLFILVTFIIKKRILIFLIGVAPILQKKHLQLKHFFSKCLVYRDQFSKRWRAKYKENGIRGLQDTRRDNSGRPNNKERSIEENYERLKAHNKLLKAENELLKKLDVLERGMRKTK